MSPIALEVRNLWVQRNSQFILEDATFKANAGSVTAIIGPNGAGKSTLLRAICGEKPYHGQVLLDGKNLYDAPEYWLRQIGYVPADDVLHDYLTVRQALMYAGRLRLPDVSAATIKSKVERTLQDMNVDQDLWKHLLKSLSTGERKKVNICAELLTDPPLLILDEPTSNLDPNAERKLMQALYARRNKQTIVIVTHTLNTVDSENCDSVVFVENRSIRKQASPQFILSNLEIELPASRGLNPQSEAKDFYRWAEIFEHFKTKPKTKTKGVTTGSQPRNEPPARRPSTLSASHIPFRHQLTSLLSRYFWVRLNERRVLLLTLFMGIVGGIFLFVLPDSAFIDNPNFRSSINITNARSAVFLLALITALIGLIAGFREVSKESRIYQHERLKGLSPLAYLLSKWIWLTLVVGVLAPVMLLGILVLVHHQPLDANPSQVAIVTFLGGLTLVLTCVAALTLGLAISALAGNDNTATVLLALTVIFHVLLSGLLGNASLKNIIDPLATFATSHWAIEGFSSSLSLYCWGPTPRFEEFNSYGHIGSTWFSLANYIFITLTIGVLVLRAKDPWSSPKIMIQSLRNNWKAVVLALCGLLCLGSWTFFLRDQSWAYYSLDYMDEAFGGFRHVSINDIPSANAPQRLNGYLSQSRCSRENLPPPPPVVVPVAAAASTPTPQTRIKTPATTLPTTPDLATTIKPTLVNTIESPQEPTAVPSPVPLQGLPQGKVKSETMLLYQPDGDTGIAKLPPGESFTLLGRNQAGSWYRVRWSNYFGWLRADQADIPPSKTNEIAAPPKCAQPRITLTKLGESWSSDFGGRLVTVVDLYRESSGTEFSRSIFQIQQNGAIVREKNQVVQAYKAQFLMLGASFDLVAKKGDSVAFLLASPGQETPLLYATIFAVPSGCSF